MATLTIELSDELMSKIAGTGRSAQEVIVDSLQRTLNSDSETSPAEQFEELSREEVIRRLGEAGYLEDPTVWDGPDAQAWRELSEQEKAQYFQEANAIRLPDSPASRYIIENRR